MVIGKVVLFLQTKNVQSPDCKVRAMTDGTKVKIIANTGEVPDSAHQHAITIFCDQQLYDIKSNVPVMQERCHATYMFQIMPLKDFDTIPQRVVITGNTPFTPDNQQHIGRVITKTIVPESHKSIKELVAKQPKTKQLHLNFGKAPF